MSGEHKVAAEHGPDVDAPQAVALPNTLLDIRTFPARKFDEACATFLGGLIYAASADNPEKQARTLAYGKKAWADTSRIWPLVLADRLSPDFVEDPGFISTHMWYNGILAIHAHLPRASLLQSMAAVHKNMGKLELEQDRYVCGKMFWAQAPEPLKSLLDFLDNVLMVQALPGVQVYRAILAPKPGAKPRPGMSVAEQRACADVLWLNPVDGTLARDE